MFTEITFMGPSASRIPGMHTVPETADAVIPAYAYILAGPEMHMQDMIF